MVGILTDGVGFRSCVCLGFEIRGIGLHEKRGFIYRVRFRAQGSRVS